MSGPYWLCDECRAEVDTPIEVHYDEEPEDVDNDEEIEAAAHFCTWSCLAAWAMREALEQSEPATDT